MKNLKIQQLDNLDLGEIEYKELHKPDLDSFSVDLKEGSAEEDEDTAPLELTSEEIDEYELEFGEKDGRKYASLFLSDDREVIMYEPITKHYALIDRMVNGNPYIKGKSRVQIGNLDAAAMAVADCIYKLGDVEREESPIITPGELQKNTTQADYVFLCKVFGVLRVSEDEMKSIESSVVVNETYIGGRGQGTVTLSDGTKVTIQAPSGADTAAVDRFFKNRPEAGGIDSQMYMLRSLITKWGDRVKVKSEDQILEDGVLNKLPARDFFRLMFLLSKFGSKNRNKRRRK